MIIIEYEKRYIEEMTSIWNEVVDEGVAFAMPKNFSNRSPIAE